MKNHYKKKEKNFIDQEFVNLFFDENNETANSENTQKINNDNTSQNISQEDKAAMHEQAKLYKKKRQKEKKEQILKINKQYPTLDPCAIGQIIKGQTTLEKELGKARVHNAKNKKERKIEKTFAFLKETYPDMSDKTAKKIASSQIRLDDYLISLDKRKTNKAASCS